MNTANKQTFRFGQRRDFAQSFAWHEAQQGARVGLKRTGGQWTVTVARHAA